MPEMHGYEATAEMRKRESKTDTGAGRIPIFALTASAMQADRDKCLRAGMDSLISKPIQAEDLRTVIGQLTGSRQRPPIPKMIFWHAVAPHADELSALRTN